MNDTVDAVAVLVAIICLALGAALYAGMAAGPSLLVVGGVLILVLAT